MGYFVSGWAFDRGAGDAYGSGGEADMHQVIQQLAAEPFELHVHLGLDANQVAEAAGVGDGTRPPREANTPISQTGSP